jgi:hypothetical protein
MSIFRSAAVVAAFAALIGASAPVKADEIIAPIFGGVFGPFSLGQARVIYYGAPQDLSSPDWYRHWLFLHQNSSGAAIYNQPCEMSNGYGPRVVPCQLVALAESPPGAPVIVAGGYGPIIERGPVRYHRHHRRYASIRARY